MTESAPAAASPSRLADLLALTKPKVTRMNVLMTGGGLALAGASITDPVVLWALLGSSLAVGSANALNMWMERDLDGLMARTANRPLPTGRMQASTALGFCLLLGVISLLVLFVLVNNPRMNDIFRGSQALKELSAAVKELSVAPRRTKD